jgi:hypothetical protein
MVNSGKKRGNVSQHSVLKNMEGSGSHWFITEVILYTITAQDRMEKKHTNTNKSIGLAII